MDKNNFDYLKSFDISHQRVNRFSFITIKKGIKLLLMPQPFHIGKEAVENYLNPQKEPDVGDLTIIARIEHKVRNIDFTCREDYPYPTLLIDEVYKVNNKQDKALMYVIENKTGTHAAVVYGFTFPEWKSKEFYDWKRSRKTYSYEISKNLVRFCKIEEVF